ncbi:hypothetical protein GGR58DRAFT_471473 [Xylaria digitata]|nr:hypothetical protein GGR58DRAFT_471473 [Xylaria digitata]
MLLRVLEHAANTFRTVLEKLKRARESVVLSHGRVDPASLIKQPIARGGNSLSLESFKRAACLGVALHFLG